MMEVVLQLFDETTIVSFIVLTAAAQMKNKILLQFLSVDGNSVDSLWVESNAFIAATQSKNRSSGAPDDLLMKHFARRGGILMILLNLSVDLDKMHPSNSFLSLALERFVQVGISTLFANSNNLGSSMTARASLSKPVIATGFILGSDMFPPIVVR